MHTGPKLHNDNLAFGYDTGYGLDQHSSTRHYKGEPATNVITAGIPGYFGSGVNGETLYRDNYLGLNSDSGVFQRNFINNPALANSSTYNNNAGLFHGGLTFSNLSSNTEYILISFDFYMIENYVRHSSSGTGLNGYIRVVYTDGSADNLGWNTSLNTPNAGDDWNNNSAYIGQWRKIALYVQVNSSKTPSSINAMYIYNDRTIKGEGVFTNFIITEHVTAPTGPMHYTSGTRLEGSTLIDLKGNQDISMNNMSFDSQGQPEFDGTDDDIDLGSDVTFSESGGNWTVESIVKYDSVPASYNNSTAPGNFIGAGGISFNSWYWSVLSSKLAIWNISPGTWKYGSTTLVANKFYHAVLVCDPGGTTYKMYLNGVQEGGSHATYSFNASYSGLKVRYFGRGSSGNPRLVNGKIPTTRIYTKALTSAQIADNFNAYKNRFNL